MVEKYTFAENLRAFGRYLASRRDSNLSLDFFRQEIRAERIGKELIRDYLRRTNEESVRGNIIDAPEW